MAMRIEHVLPNTWQGANVLMRSLPMLLTVESGNHERGVLAADESTETNCKHPSDINVENDEINRRAHFLSFSSAPLVAFNTSAN